MTTETERIVHDGFHLQFTGCVRYVVEVALGIGVFEIDGWWHDSAVECQGRGGRFNGTGLVICNPPWQFEETLAALLTGLWPHLADGPGAGKVIDVIAGE